MAGRMERKPINSTDDAAGGNDYADDAGREAQNGIYLRVRPIVFTINLEYKGGKDPNELSEESIIKYAKKARQQITQHEQQQQMRFAMKGQHTCAD